MVMWSSPAQSWAPQQLTPAGKASHWWVWSVAHVWRVGSGQGKSRHVKVRREHFPQIYPFLVIDIQTAITKDCQ